MSESNRVALTYCPEVTYGTLPANALTWKTARPTDMNFAAAPRTVMSEELLSNRMVSDLVVTGLDVQGEMGFELTHTTYDDFFEAVMGGTWTTNVLNAGTAQKSFCIQQKFGDWGTPHYLLYRGMRVGTFDLDVAFGQIVKGKFGFQGNGTTSGTVDNLGTGTLAAASTTEVMDAAAGLTAITLDGGAPGAAIKRVSLRVENNLRPIEGVGQAAPTGIAYGRSIVTGTLEMYFETAAMYAKLLAGTSAALSFTLTKSAKSYTFLVPKLKFNSGAPAVPGVDTDVMIPLAFTGLYDAGATNTNLRITRVP